MSEKLRIVDITCTVKASEAAGRRLLKNLDDGNVFWELNIVEDTEAPVVEDTETPVVEDTEAPVDEEIQTGPATVEIVEGKPAKGKRREKKIIP